MNIEQLRTIAQEAQIKLRHVYELYGLGEPPQVTPGLVDAVLEAAGYEREQIFERAHIAQVNDVPMPAGRAEIQAAVLQRLRELAIVMPDGSRIMPPQYEYERNRGDLPGVNILYYQYGKRKWAEWASLADLKYMGPGNRKREKNTESPLGAEATFPQVSARAASVLGPEHIVVSPHGSERNGHASRD